MATRTLPSKRRAISAERVQTDSSLPAIPSRLSLSSSHFNGHRTIIITTYVGGHNVRKLKIEVDGARKTHVHGLLGFHPSYR